MLKFRIRVNPHNTLETLAHYHVSVVKEKIASKNYDGISLDCTSAIIAMAFAVEAILNFVGSKRVAEWRERAPFAAKVKVLEARLSFEFDTTADPFKTVSLLKQARDTMAHGQPVEFEVTVETDRQIGKSLQPTWSSATKPEFVLAAYAEFKAFKDLLFRKARIKPGAALTSAIGGG